MGESNAKGTQSKPQNYGDSYWEGWSKVYDKIVKVAFLPFGGESRFRNKFVDNAGPMQNENVLDLCCGTGSVTKILSQRVLPNGSVTGVDLSEHMLAKAKAKINAENTTFRTASADKLPFKDQTFDKAFISYGMHELPKKVRQKAIKELYRVLKPGGALVLVDYYLPKNPITRFPIAFFVKFFEEKIAYQMIKEDPLTGELKAARFKIGKQSFPLGGMFQVIRADKA